MKNITISKTVLLFLLVFLGCGEGQEQQVEPYTNERLEIDIENFGEAAQAWKKEQGGNGANAPADFSGITWKDMTRERPLLGDRQVYNGDTYMLEGSYIATITDRQPLVIEATLESGKEIIVEVTGVREEDLTVTTR